jgi:hypothetical protein
MEDAVVAARVLRSLDPEELAVATVYRRHGGSFNGEVIRLELMARGVLQISEKRVSDFYTTAQWKRAPISSLADRWVLLAERDDFAWKGTRSFRTLPRRLASSASRVSGRLTPGCAVGCRPGIGLTVAAYQEIRIQRSC